MRSFISKNMEGYYMSTIITICCFLVALTGPAILNILAYQKKKKLSIKISDYIPNEVTIEDYTKYFKLTNSDSELSYITIEDYYSYTISYSKSISTVYLSNMKNLTLYQDQRAISYEE